MGDILKLIVLAQTTAFDDSRYQVKAIQPFVQRVRRLVEGHVFETQWSSASRWETLEVYAEALRTLGEQSGNNENLEESIAAHRRALKDVPREQVPLDWAITQNNLGIALARLGNGRPVRSA